MRLGTRIMAMKSSKPNQFSSHFLEKWPSTVPDHDNPQIRFAEFDLGHFTLLKQSRVSSTNIVLVIGTHHS